MRMLLAILGTVTVMSPALAADAVKLQTKLTGAAEVPGPGDPDGDGMASVTIDTAEGEVCYMLHVSGIDAATMAHIHKGAKDAAGPPVVTLEAPASGMSEACAPVAADVAAALIAKPGDYYVNVHNAAFPKGALRGQLGQ